MKNLTEYLIEGKINFYLPKDKKELKKAIKMLLPKEWNKIDTSKIIDISELFMNYKGVFGDISNWDVSNVTNMSRMFERSTFKGDVSNWDVSNVTDMHGLFEWCKFNGDISKWDVSNVVNMSSMFYANKSFNGDISKWDVSSLVNVRDMFAYSNFNKDINNWVTPNLHIIFDAFKDSPLEKNPPKWYLHLLGWDELDKKYKI